MSDEEFLDEEWEDDEDDDGLDEGGEPFRYFDLHPTREDLMGLTYPQSECIRKLWYYMGGLYRAEKWFIGSRLGIYYTDNPKEYPMEADVAVFKGVTRKSVLNDEQGLQSWKMVRPDRPAPNIVFDITQHKLWRADLYEKPAQYQRVGVRECFVYDPHKPLCWDKDVALVGWRFRGLEVEKIQTEPDGRMWSEELERWLVPDGIYLRVYDQNNQLCPEWPPYRD